MYLKHTQFHKIIFLIDLSLLDSVHNLWVTACIHKHSIPFLCTVKLSLIFFLKACVWNSISDSVKDAIQGIQYEYFVNSSNTHIHEDTPIGNKPPFVNWICNLIRHNFISLFWGYILFSCLQLLWCRPYLSWQKKLPGTAWCSCVVSIQW